MATTRDDFGGDVYVAGTLSCHAFTPPAGSIGDAAVVALAGIQATKLQHQHEETYSQESSLDATVESHVMHIVKGATATIVDFRAGSVVKAAAAGNAVVDLLKNGTTVLTGTITLDSANSNYVPEAAPGFTSTALVAGDVLEFKLTSSAATKPKGVFAQLIVREDAQ